MRKFPRCAEKTFKPPLGWVLRNVRGFHSLEGGLSGRRNRPLMLFVSPPVISDVSDVSENNPKRKLDLPGSSRGVVNDPEAAAAQGVRRNAEIYQVKNVKEFRPKL